MLRKAMNKNVFIAAAVVVALGIAAICLFSHHAKYTVDAGIVSKIGAIHGGDGLARCAAFSSADFLAITARHCLSGTDENVFQSRDLSIWASMQNPEGEYKYGGDIAFIKRNVSDNELVATCTKIKGEYFYYSSKDAVKKSVIRVKQTIGGMTFFEKSDLKKGDSGMPIFSNESNPCLIGVYGGWIDINDDKFDYFLNVPGSP